MTVALGFHCTNGVVLAADSEISNSFVKYPGDKAWLYKYPRTASQFALQVGIVGAGDAAFIQYAAERIDAAIEPAIDRRKQLTMPEVNSVIQGVINDLHHSHLYPVPAGAYEPPRVELIVGLMLASNRIRLAKTHLTAITKVGNYEAVGVGSALANFIIKRFYGGRVTIEQAVFIATQVLMHVKENVPACGGESKVLVMFQGGTVGFVRPETIQEHERFLNDFDKIVQPVFFGGPDATLSNRERELMHHLMKLRSALEDAPHSSVCGNEAYDSWYRQVRGPVLESTDPNRWKPVREDCYQCDGEGMIGIYNCPRCGGSGRER